jgi:hypothetical protein
MADLINAEADGDRDSGFSGLTVQARPNVAELQR